MHHLFELHDALTYFYLTSLFKKSLFALILIFSSGNSVFDHLLS